MLEANYIIAIQAVTIVALVFGIAISDYRRRKRAELTPGECECGHPRCCHHDGNGECDCMVDDDEDYTCACDVYILASKPSKDADVERLRKMTGL